MKTGSSMKKQQLSPFFSVAVSLGIVVFTNNFTESMSSSEHKLSEKVAEGGMLNTGLSTDVVDHKNGAYAQIKDVESPELGMFDKPLPCFGCGIGWFSLLLGLACPLLWYYATFLYFRKYYQRDPRERDGLAANAVAALICTIAVIIAGVVILIINLATNPH